MTRRIEPWDFPDRASERRRSFDRVIDAEYRVVHVRPARPAAAISFLSCLMIVGVLAIVLLRFMWPALLMAAVMFGITTQGEMVATFIGPVFIGAVALRERLSGRPF